MLGSFRVIATIAVNDIENAIDFYGDVLGLEKVEIHRSGHLFKSGGGGLIGLHVSPTAGSGQGTCAWWTVDNVEKTVRELKKKGVVFDQNYDLLHTKRKGDIYILSDTQKAAWFRDPDGNILGLGNF